MTWRSAADRPELSSEDFTDAPRPPFVLPVFPQGKGGFGAEGYRGDVQLATYRPSVDELLELLVRMDTAHEQQAERVAHDNSYPHRNHFRFERLPADFSSIHPLDDVHTTAGTDRCALPVGRDVRWVARPAAIHSLRLVSSPDAVWWEAHSMADDHDIEAGMLTRPQTLEHLLHAAAPRAAREIIRVLVRDYPSRVVALLEDGLRPFVGEEPARELTDLLEAEGLVQLLRHADDGVRKQALAALATHRDPGSPSSEGGGRIR